MLGCTLHQASSYLPIQSAAHCALPPTRYHLPLFAFVMTIRRKAGQAIGREIDDHLSERILLIMFSACSLART